MDRPAPVSAGVGVLMLLAILLLGGRSTDCGSGPFQPSPPSPPGNPLAWLRRDTVILWWIAQGETDVVSFNVYRRVGASEFAAINSEPLEGPPGWQWLCQYFDEDVDPDSDLEYCYYVTAVDVDGTESAPSPEVRAVLSEITGHPQTVEGVSPASGSLDVPVRPVFEWLPAAGATTYCLWLSVAPHTDMLTWMWRDTTTSIELGADSGITYWPLVEDELRYGTRYECYVLAVDADNMVFAVGGTEFKTVERSVPSN